MLMVIRFVFLRIGCIGNEKSGGSSTDQIFLHKGKGSVSPTLENIISDAYSLSRPFYFYTNGEPSGITEKFTTLF